MRLDSNIESKSSNNTYLNIMEILNKLFFIIKFGCNLDFEKMVILSELEKLRHLIEKLSAAPTFNKQQL